MQQKRMCGFLKTRLAAPLNGHAKNLPSTVNMALINIGTALRDAIRLISNTPINSGIEIMSYKRNRTVALIRLSDHRVLLREQGYIEEETEVDLKRLSKKLKTVFKREFPRSRKVRFFKFANILELERIHQKI